MDGHADNLGLATFPGCESQKRRRLRLRRTHGSCDCEVRFWLNAKMLKNRNQWQPGWKSLQEQMESEIPEDVEVLNDF